MKASGQNQNKYFCFILSHCSHIAQSRWIAIDNKARKNQQGRVFHVRILLGFASITIDHLSCAYTDYHENRNPQKRPSRAFSATARIVEGNLETNFNPIQLCHASSANNNTAANVQCRKIRNIAILTKFAVCERFAHPYLQRSTNRSLYTNSTGRVDHILCECTMVAKFVVELWGLA